MKKVSTLLVVLAALPSAVHGVDCSDLVVALAPLLSTIQLVNCNACDDSCGVIDLECQGKKTACKAAAATIEVVTSPVEAACANDPRRMDGREILEEAKSLAYRLGFANPEEVSNVQLRFCSSMDSETGLTPSPTKILFHTSYITSTKEELFAILVHEMVHIRQYIAYKIEGFQCRYAKEVASGNGCNRGNRLEDEAYAEEDRANAALQTLPDLEQTVRDVYCRVLFRDADTNGLNGGIALLASGDATVKDLVRNAATSPEFENRFVKDRTVEDVVETLYDALLARPVDPTGLETWKVEIQNNGHVSAVDGILGSAEYNSNFGTTSVPGNGRAGCGSRSPAPTPGPTPNPTERTTPSPTEPPTLRPVRQPTDEPNPDPTPQPVRQPTDEPNPGPTPQPVRQPTDEPNPDPTPQPVRQPTDEPNPGPTPQPVRQPTDEPNPDPTHQPVRQPISPPYSTPTPGSPVVDPTIERTSPKPTSSPILTPRSLDPTATDPTAALGSGNSLPNPLEGGDSSGSKSQPSSPLAYLLRLVLALILYA